MKTYLTILLILAGELSFAQICFCDKDSVLNELISCDTIQFDNQAKLYWNFNCDSSWLTFESPENKKEIILSLGDGLQYYTGRIGFIGLQEYKNTFLVQNNVISGCCSPSDFYLFDKVTGQLKRYIGRLIYYSEDKNIPIIVSLTGSSYDTTVISDYNSLTVYNVNTEKTYFVKLPENEIENALVKVKQNYPEYLFEEPIVKDKILALTYYVRKPKNKKDKPTKTIFIDLSNYSN